MVVAKNETCSKDNSMMGGHPASLPDASANFVIDSYETRERQDKTKTKKHDVISTPTRLNFYESAFKKNILMFVTQHCRYAT